MDRLYLQAWFKYSLNLCVHLISFSSIGKWVKKQHRKEENIGKKKINLAGLGIAHQAIVQQAIALETKVKHHFSEEKKKENNVENWYQW